MNNKMKFIFPVIIIILLIGVWASIYYMENRYDVVDDVSELKVQAEQLYLQGDISSAIVKLQAYCNNEVIDIDAKTTLGDWYMETGDESAAYRIYYEAAKSKKHQEERIQPLSVRNTSEVITEPITDTVIEITPDVRCTKDMTLTITGHNLAPDVRYTGKITDGRAALSDDENYHTTDWFPVDPDGKYLTMSGGFNCAVWQFKDSSGNIPIFAESPNTYRQKDTYETDIYQMARAFIPEEAAYCRVTYFDDDKKEETASVEEQLTIVYGRLPGESVKASINHYTVPDLKEGEKIVFKNNEWKLVSQTGETTLTDWAIPAVEKGSHFSIGGTLPGKVCFENSTFAQYGKDGIYTIRFDLSNPSAVGERLDDAKNLAFNAVIGNGYLSSGENHFDHIYPWSDMKLCTINNGEVIYSGDSRFSTTGSAGDVFVEIPKFYTRRVTNKDYDTISVSGQMHDGFELDEAFVTKSGEAEKIYIAAYLTGEDESGFNSKSGENPVLGMTPEELVKKTRAKGEGYEEIDYAALSALQKLFMVETGLRNSQYIFMGICAYSLPLSEDDYISVALTDRTKTNCIEVSDTHTFLKGNSIVLFNSKDVEVQNAVSRLEPKKVTTVIDNGDGTQTVYFSGDPVSVRRDATAIVHISTENGSSESVGAHTGSVSTARGTVAFRYRNIENLWGNAYVYVDNVTVKNSVATITDRRGNVHPLTYSLPSYEGDILDCFVSKIGYDAQYPNVMLPSLTDNKATISTYYGDAYIDEGDSEGDNALYYGGAWNTRAAAGLFSYIVSPKAEGRVNASGRMMYIKS